MTHAGRSDPLGRFHHWSRRFILSEPPLSEEDTIDDNFASPWYMETAASTLLESCSFVPVTWGGGSAKDSRSTLTGIVRAGFSTDGAIALSTMASVQDGSIMCCAGCCHDMLYWVQYHSIVPFGWRHVTRVILSPRVNHMTPNEIIEITYCVGSINQLGMHMLFCISLGNILLIHQCHFQTFTKVLALFWRSSTLHCLF